MSANECHRCGQTVYYTGDQGFFNHSADHSPAGIGCLNPPLPEMREFYNPVRGFREAPRREWWLGWLLP